MKADIIKVMPLLLCLVACNQENPQTSTEVNKTQNDITTAKTNTVQTNTVKTIVAKSVRALDGDTIEVTLSGQQSERVRLAGIDAPESKQAGGKESTQNLEKCLKNQPVKVQWFKKDKYQRIVGYVIADKKSCNLQQLKDGAAWYYKAFESELSQENRITYANAEVSARTQSKGLWQSSCVIAPWEWRKGKKIGCSKKPVTNAKPKVCASIATTCSKLSNCTQAYTALNACGIKNLDRNGDGVPCEALCKK